MHGERTPTDIDRIAEAWVDTSVELHPEDAVYLGRPGFEGFYSDYSPDGLDADETAERAVLARLAAIEPADAVDAVTKADLRREIELSLEARAAGMPLRDVNAIESPVQGIRDVFDLEPAETADDWAAIATRLGNVEAALDGYAERLRLGVRRGVVPARRQVALAAGQAREFAAADGFFAALARRGEANESVPSTLSTRLASSALTAAHAYERLADVLEQEVAPSAGEVDAVGREAYSLGSRRSSAPPSISTRRTSGDSRNSSAWRRSRRWSRIGSSPAAPSRTRSRRWRPTRPSSSTARRLCSPGCSG